MKLIHSNSSLGYRVDFLHSFRGCHERRISYIQLTEYVLFVKVNSSLDRKIKIQKKEFKLFINNKKELVIQENKLFSDIKMLNFNDGNATENRTPITGMRIPCPNR